MRLDCAPGDRAREIRVQGVRKSWTARSMRHASHQLVSDGRAQRAPRRRAHYEGASASVAPSGRAISVRAFHNYLHTLLCTLHVHRPTHSQKFIAFAPTHTRCTLRFTESTKTERTPPFRAPPEPPPPRLPASPRCCRCCSRRPTSPCPRRPPGWSRTRRRAARAAVEVGRARAAAAGQRLAVPTRCCARGTFARLLVGQDGEAQAVRVADARRGHVELAVGEALRREEDADALERLALRLAVLAR